MWNNNFAQCTRIHGINNKNTWILFYQNSRIASVNVAKRNTKVALNNENIGFKGCRNGYNFLFAPHNPTFSRCKSWKFQSWLSAARSRFPRGRAKQAWRFPTKEMYLQPRREVGSVGVSRAKAVESRQRR